MTSVTVESVVSLDIGNYESAFHIGSETTTLEVWCGEPGTNKPNIIFETIDTKRLRDFCMLLIHELDKAIP